VLLMDLSMPDQSGVDALAAIKARCPELPVLILSGFPEAHYATTLLRQGASGYLNKECDPEEIATAIRTVARGRKLHHAGGGRAAGRRRWPAPGRQAAARAAVRTRAAGLPAPGARARRSATWPTACPEREDRQHLPHARDGEAEAQQSPTAT
jgi:DNA-binding NarL/FixJ family response regulator